MSDWTSGPVRLLHGDCRERLRELPDASVDAAVTDPPYGLSREPDIAEVVRHWLAGDEYEHGSAGFMGRSWDSFVPGPEYWREVYRVMKPGAHLLAFSSTRTWDLLSLAIRFAGFENRDTIASEGPPALRWMHGQGFPKGLDVSKAIDRMAGAEREVLAERPAWTASMGWRLAEGRADRFSPTPITTPATDEARRWQGWNVALKPAWEAVLVFRRPFRGSVATNILEHGTGAINVGGCRVGTGADKGVWPLTDRVATRGSMAGPMAAAETDCSIGRWPANLVLSHAEGCVAVGARKVRGIAPPGRPSRGMASVERRSLGDFASNPVMTRHADPDGTETVESWECVEGCPVAELDRQSGERIVGKGGTNHTALGLMNDDGWQPTDQQRKFYDDTGAASRFYYCAKASPRERSAGLPPGERNTHPTVKPLALMRWLCRLVTPQGGVILDPFAGSGTTLIAAVLEGFQAIGIEQDEESVRTALARLTYWRAQPRSAPRPATRPAPHPADATPALVQVGLFDESAT